MPAQTDMNRAPGGVSPAALAERLGRAVGEGMNGKVQRNGNGAIAVPSARDVALDACRAILAEAGADTAEHSDDVVLITEAIGERMGFSGTAAQDLLVAAQLHDIGKVWVPSAILEKAGPLTDQEWAVMRRHTLVGEEILSTVDELAEVGRLVRHSHERWDGAGYPDGLEKEETPLGSRIIFCADAFHAIRSDRPYRAGRSAKEAVAEIEHCAGTQFDPTVADALVDVVRERGRPPLGGGGSSRLFALFMCLVVGGAGTALARSDLFKEPSPPPNASIPAPPPGCGTAACPTVAAPVGGLAAVGGTGFLLGPRPLHPGLPGRPHGGVVGGNASAVGGKENNGQSGDAKNDHPSNGNGRALGHSESHPTGQSSGSHSAAAPSSSSSTHGGSSGGSGGTHHASNASSGRHSSGSRGAPAARAEVDQAATAPPTATPAAQATPARRATPATRADPADRTASSATGARAPARP